MSLEFEKLSNRHREIIHELLFDPDVMKFTPVGVAQNIEAADKILNDWISLNFDHTQLGHYAIKDVITNKYIGWGMLCPDRNNDLFLGYMVSKSNWQKGYGKKICIKLLNIASTLGLYNKIFASVVDLNVNSIKILNSVGMTPLKKDENVIIFGMEMVGSVI